jgi:hypothetical protein
MCRCAGVAIVGVALVACGGTGDTRSPAAPTPTITGITVSGPSMVFIGATESYTASATLSNGSTEVPACAWGGDAPTVATVEPSTGRVTGTGSGEVTIWCDARGVRGTKRVRVLPNYQGTWLGSYAVDACEQSGDFALVGFCANFPRDRVFPLSGMLTQQNDTVTGAFHLGQVQGQQASGPVALDGTLRLTIVHVGTGSFTLTSDWAVNSTRPGQLSGSMVQLWRDAALSGTARVATRVFNTNRQAAGLGNPGPSGFGAAPRTLRELLGRLGG